MLFESFQGYPNRVNILHMDIYDDHHVYDDFNIHWALPEDCSLIEKKHA